MWLFVFIPKQYFGYLDKGQFLVKGFYHVGFSAVNSTDQSIQRCERLGNSFTILRTSQLH